MDASRRPSAGAALGLLSALGLCGAVLVTPAALAALSGPEALVGHDPDTGRLIFVGGLPGRPVPASVAGVAAVSPGENGLTFVKTYASQLGLRAPDSELRAFHTARRDDGGTVVRYRQVHEGVPVFGADVVVNTDRNGGLLALSAKISPALSVVTEPTLGSEDAVETAVAAMAKYYGISASDLRGSAPELWIYDPRLLLPSARAPVLTWMLEVSDGARIRERVLVDARRKAIALHFNQVDVTWNTRGSTTSTGRVEARGEARLQALGTPLLSVHTMDHACLSDDAHCSGAHDALPGALVCTEENPADCSESDAANAYRFGLDTYDFYAGVHGRDSVDGRGQRLIFSVHYGLGYQNAYWNGEQMVFGDGFSAADDIVGHELTHGVTASTSGLIYYGQPGAINESFSDIWGEFVDQTNGRGTDTASSRWLIGEDLSGSGAGRDMKNPPAFGDPDGMLSAHYQVGPSDNYGVHTNSGVNNKAAYLLTDGGAFGGKTVTALGLRKTAALYYEAQTHLLGSGANYLDLYYALRQACSNLVGTFGITSSDCQSVRDATDAVQMNKTKSAAIYPTVDYCPARRTMSPAGLFDDDMESGSTNWTMGMLTGSSQWFVDSVRSDSSSGSSALVWDGPSGASDSYAAMAADVALPAGSRPYLRFEHDVCGFESPYDGGVVEYSIDGGTTWRDLSSKFAGGRGYGGALFRGSGNPLGGRKAFGGFTVNYTESLYDLSALAGNGFRMRFRAASDASVESYPWFVDDVRIYTCVPMPTRPILRRPATNALVTDYTPTLDWTDSSGGVVTYNVQIATDRAFSALLYDESGLAASELTVPTDLTPNATYYWRVRSLNSAGAGLGWSDIGVFRTAISPPALVAPGDGVAVHARRPTFDWGDVFGASGYAVQVADDPAFTTVLDTGVVAAPVSTYTPATDLPANATLYWRVRARGANGPSLHSDARLMTTGNPPTVPMPLSPAPNALVTEYAPRIDWSASAARLGTTFDSYQLQVDDDPDFSSTLLDVRVPGSAAHEFTPSEDFAANSRFFWRVRSWTADGDFSGWSAARCFRTAVTPPVLTAPTDAASVQSRRPTLDWDDVAGATSYTLQVSRVATFANALLTSTFATATSVYAPAEDLPANALLYWRVRANGANGPGLFSSVRSIKTGNPPGTPELLRPAVNALTADYTPRLDWAVVTVPAGTDFDRYQVQVDDDPDFLSTVVDESVSGLAAHERTPVAELSANTKFYWRVRSWNDAGDVSAWSTVRCFRTAMTPPVPVAPIDATSVRSRRPTFDWDDVAGATGYALQVSREPTFADPVLTSVVSTAVSRFTPAVDLPGSALLYWRVRANGPNGPSLHSSVWSIKTGNPPGIPVLLLPAAGALTADYTPRLDWGAASVPAGTRFDHYQVQVAERSDFSSPIVDEDVFSTHEYTPLIDLAANAKIYWRVRSWSDVGDTSAWSALRYFQTALAPPPLDQPVDGAPAHARRPVFDWDDVPGATGYTLQISAVGSFASVVLTARTAASTYASSADLLAGARYYWRVRADGANGPGGWSETWGFTTPDPPSTPALLSPTQDAVVTDLTPLLDWGIVTVPAGTTFDHYEVQVAALDASYASTTSVPSLAEHELIPVSDLAASTVYAWKVRAWNSDGDASAWSEVRWFYVDAP